MNINESEPITGPGILWAIDRIQKQFMTSDYSKQSNSLVGVSIDAVRAVMESQRWPFSATMTTSSEDDGWEAEITVKVREAKSVLEP